MANPNKQFKTVAANPNTVVDNTPEPAAQPAAQPEVVAAQPATAVQTQEQPVDTKPEPETREVRVPPAADQPKNMEVTAPDPVQAVASGRAALVPLDWLERVLTKGQTEDVLTRRRVKRAIRRQSEPRRQVAVRRQATAAPATKGTFGTKIAGIYKLSGKARDTVRGRDTIKKVFAYLKDHPNGVTAKRIVTDMKMPTSTVQYTLGRLLEKQAISYHRGA